MGEGDFCEGRLCDRLQLRIDRDDPEHGLVEPDCSMTLADFRSAVVATRLNWVQDAW
jgi:hypothetical protein